VPRRSPLHHDPAAVTWARKAKRWRQRELAAAVGISVSLMSEIESGSRNAGPDLLYRIAEALNCPVSMLERKPPR
jgi:transcriptional regulator with XRE-family HTH domain